jgi:hypothetical protein
MMCLGEEKFGRKAWMSLLSRLMQRLTWVFYGNSADSAYATIFFAKYDRVARLRHAIVRPAFSGGATKPSSGSIRPVCQ